MDGLHFDDFSVFLMSVSMHFVTQNKDSTLMISVQHGRSEVFSLLLKAGANTDMQDWV